MSIIALIIFLLFLAGIILLQIYLSKKQNKWIGLVLPGICLSISILAVMGSVSFFSFTKETVTTIRNNSDVVNEVICNTTNKNNVDLSSVIFTSIIIFLMYNIPTAILLSIYAGCREKIKKNLELGKMNVQDLE